MKKLTKIRLINWHYFSNETIEVNNNVLLTGQNATGKSTILDAITFVITGGDTDFNKAANENSKRDLKGYVKCKVSRVDKEYLRAGDVTGHICLEFFDDVKKDFFVVGAVIDAFGELLPAEYVLYQSYGTINDSMFVTDDGIIRNISEFKAHNTGFEIFKTKKEAKRAYKTLFGNLNDNFFRLIHKALAFKPIADVKTFIYDHLLEEKQIDVANIVDSIRSYKELEGVLNVIKDKIVALHDIKDIYDDINTNLETKHFYDFVLQLFEEKAIEIDIKDLTVTKAKVIASGENNVNDIRKIDKEIESLEEQSRELYKLLSEDKDFAQSEYLDKQIAKTRGALIEYQDAVKPYLARVSEIKDAVKEMRRIEDNDCLKKLANINLIDVHADLVERTRSELISIDSFFDAEYDRLSAIKNSYETEKQRIVGEINEIANTLRSLENRSLKYDFNTIALKKELEEGLKEVYGKDISVYVLAELLEITDPKWADTIEVYLNRNRFNIIVAPQYYDTALQIYNRVMRTKGIHDARLINTKQIQKFVDCQPRSMASIIDSENVDAKRYINYLCGHVILCDDVLELEKYSAAITNEGMVYQGYSVFSLNYDRVQRPFIGSDASDRQLANFNKISIEKKKEYQEVTENINKYSQLLRLYHQLDLSFITDRIHLSASINKASEELAKLEEKKKNEEMLTPSGIKTEYDKVLANIKKLQAEKAMISESSGTIKERVSQLETQILDLQARLSQIHTDLAELKLQNISIENEANAEVEKAFKENKDVKVNQTKYAKMVEELDGIISGLVQKLQRLEFNYNVAYNTAYGVGLAEVKPFMDELNKLEKSEIITYEQKVRSAREDAEILFKEDFLSKLRNYIMTAEDEIRKINETLSTISFGEDSYEFVFPKSKELGVFYDMVTSDVTTLDTGVMSFDFDIKYHEQLDELFTSLAIDEENSNGAINKFTDYRTYMDYDIKIHNKITNTDTLYSQVFKEKSGGETQVPFYVAIIASFVRTYTKNSATSNSIGIAMFDEVFDKMDPQRMKAMMKFIRSLPIQILLACPSGKAKDLSRFTETIIVALRQGERAQIFSCVADDLEKILSKNDK